MKKFKFLFIIIIAIFLLFYLLNTSYAQISYIWYNPSNVEALETNSNSNSVNLELESGGAILIEQTSGTILYDHNSHEKFRPASVTKIMTLLLIMEAIDNR